MNEPGFLEDAKKARDLAAQEAVLAKNKCRDEAFAAHIRAGGGVADFQEPSHVQQGVEDVKLYSKWLMQRPHGTLSPR